MAVKINETCIGCGACCAGACPVSALTMGGEGRAVVDEGACIDCGTCVGICPVAAITQ